jgi:hypothetical protein
MRPASIQEIRNQLHHETPEALIDLILRLARFKQENKALVTYRIFDSIDEDAFVVSVQQMISEVFVGVNPAPYLAKKTIRKAIRMGNQAIKYSGIPTTEISILLCLLQEMEQAQVDISSSPVLINLAKGLFKRAKKCHDGLHEDLQFEYRTKIQDISNWLMEMD